jgi:hypothetical protein
MKNYFIYGILFIFIIPFQSCSKDNEKPTIQILADKEKELNDREARIKLKEIELEERERKLSQLESDRQTSGDTANVTENDGEKSEKKKEIQKEMSQKFENPTITVKDYFEYIQRAVNESGNFDANMSKAQKLFPSRSVDKLKNSYRKTKQFTVLEEPKVVSQKDNKCVVSAKVKQVELISKDGGDQEVDKTLTVTYSLTANNIGQWVISSVKVSSE